MAPSNQSNTRQLSEWPYFGTYNDLCEFVLPTCKDVMKCYWLVRYNMEIETEPTLNYLGLVVAIRMTFRQRIRFSRQVHGYHTPASFDSSWHLSTLLGCMQSRFGVMPSAMGIQKCNGNRLMRTNGRADSVYHAVSESAIFVIAGVIPVHLVKRPIYQK